MHLCTQRNVRRQGGDSSHHEKKEIVWSHLNQDFIDKDCTETSTQDRTIPLIVFTTSLAFLSYEENLLNNVMHVLSTK